MDGEDEDGMGLDENGETLRRGDTMDAGTPATGPTLVEQVKGYTFQSFESGLFIMKYYFKIMILLSNERNYSNIGTKEKRASWKETRADPSI